MKLVKPMSSFHTHAIKRLLNEVDVNMVCGGVFQDLHFYTDRAS